MKKRVTTTEEIVNNKKITTVVTVEDYITNDVTAIVAVLDHSFSMSNDGFIYTAITKYNEFIGSQKALPGKATLTEAIFDHEYDVITNNIDLQDAKPMTIEVWKPRGMTRLLDAVGKTITTLKSNFAKMKPEDVPSKVLVVIYTDGQENDSKEFTNDSIRKLIGECEKDNWNFIFLGADQNSFDASHKMGISRGNTMVFSKSALGADLYTQKLKHATTSYRSMSVSDDNFIVGSKSLMADDAPSALANSLSLNNNGEMVTGTITTTDLKK